MTAIKDLLNVVDAAIADLSRAQAGAMGVAIVASRALGMAQHLGLSDQVEQVRQIKETTEAAVREIAAIAGRVEGARRTTKAMLDST